MAQAPSKCRKGTLKASGKFMIYIQFLTIQILQIGSPFQNNDGSMPIKKGNKVTILSVRSYKHWIYRTSMCHMRTFLQLEGLQISQIARRYIYEWVWSFWFLETLLGNTRAFLDKVDIGKKIKLNSDSTSKRVLFNKF